MTVEDAIPRIRGVLNVPFGKLLKELPLDLRLAKGRSGYVLEELLGLPPGNRENDFENGELKTNKSDSHGKPLETIYIMQIASIIDELICENPAPFAQTKLYLKIRNLVIVPVVKEGDERSWYYREIFHLRSDPGSLLFKALEEDYKVICAKLRHQVLKGKDGFIHTSNGLYLQVRTKDAEPYRAIKSRMLNRAVSNKNHAFYFKKTLAHDIRMGNFGLSAVRYYAVGDLGT